MKIWVSEHTFDHPWERITQACWRKYPNPLNTAVVGLDVVERKVTPGGLLLTHRLLSTRWGLPAWASRLLSVGGDCYASEHSVVDPHARTMTLESKNLSFTNELSIVERLTYRPHPSNPNSTLLTQEAVVTVQGIPLSSYLESHVANTISANANKGRQAMEWVVQKLNEEVNELSSAAAHKFPSEPLPNLNFEK